jgi:hypothetical protein
MVAGSSGVLPRGTGLVVSVAEASTASACPASRESGKAANQGRLAKGGVHMNITVFVKNITKDIFSTKSLPISYRKNSRIFRNLFQCVNRRWIFSVIGTLTIKKMFLDQ